MDAANLIGRRYQLLSTLGHGGMGTVYRAFDRLTGQVIALKQVAPPELATDGEEYSMTRLALANEFKLLASLRHPHIINVLDYGFQGNQPYYTMELLEGAQNLLEAAYDQPLRLQIDLLVQLLLALSYLHRRGILHRDLKPSNVLVVNHQVKVLDFGLATTREQLRQGEPLVGTLAYMPPEVLRGQKATEAADLYAVGVLAYEMLTGRHPYETKDMSRLIQDVLHRPLDYALATVEHQTAHILEGLLAKNPSQRYPSADAVIHALSERLNIPLPLETAATRESLLQTAPFVGRDAEIETLSAALQKTLSGVGSAWLIGGESGVGKSRLIDEARVMGMVGGALVVRGTNVPVGATPYHMWRAVLRWLAIAGEATPAEASILAAIAPDLNLLLDQPLQPISNTTDLPTKITTLAEGLIQRVGTPIMAIFEDLHWADPESLALLDLFSRLTQRLPLMIVASYRNDERPDLPEVLPGLRPIALSRLDAAAIAQLSAAMLGDTGRQEPVLELLQRETEGNVFFLIEVVRALADEAGRLEDIGSRTLPQAVFAGGIRRILNRRLNRIPFEDMPLLQTAAVAGRELDLNLIRAVAGPEYNVQGWLMRCADAAVLEVYDNTWRFAHDKLRASLIDQLSEEERRALHRHIANAVMFTYPNRPEFAGTLAYHWGGAGDLAQEAHFSRLAGEQALRIGAYREAIARLERALSLTTPQTPHPEVRKMRAALAEGHLGRGEYEVARRLYTENLNTARADRDREGEAVALHALGDVDYFTENYAAAEQRYREALALFRAIGDTLGEARTLNRLGDVAFETGEDDAAYHYYQESLTLSRRVGAQWGMAGSLRGIEGGETSE